MDREGKDDELQGKGLWVTHGARQIVMIEESFLNGYTGMIPSSGWVTRFCMRSQSECVKWILCVWSLWLRGSVAKSTVFMMNNRSQCWESAEHNASLNVATHFLHQWQSSTGSGGKGHSAMIRGQRCMCDCVERINADRKKIKLHSWRWFQSSRNSSSKKKA